MKRPLTDIVAAPFRKQFHKAFWTSLSAFDDPGDVLTRYAFGTGSYPARIGVKTPMGRINPLIWSFDDIRTLVECFAKTDYPVAPGRKVIVDVGANIGLSALYFLTRDPNNFVYLMEPVPQNMHRLRRNLEPYQGRWTLIEKAAGLEDGTARFGVETTGRYGGIGLDFGGGAITVEVAQLNHVLRRVLQECGQLDVLKLDVEGLERQLLDALPQDLLHQIGAIYAETFGDAPDFGGFARREWGGITQYRRLQVA